MGERGKNIIRLESSKLMFSKEGLTFNIKSIIDKPMTI